MYVVRVSVGDGHCRFHWPRLLAVLFGLLIMLAACRTDTIPNPTVIPTIAPNTTSPSLTPSPTLSVSLTPGPTFRPIITSTSGPTAVAVVADAPTTIPSPTPVCFNAKTGDTIVTLLLRGGYNDLSAAPAFRQVNNMPPGSSVIQAGQLYCIPRQTSTPTPEGYEQTRAAQQAILPTAGAVNLVEYTVKEGDTTLGIEIRTGVALSLFCRLNPAPDGLNCAGCDLNAPIYQAKCRVTLRVGQKLKYPGPTPTPSVTPTLTGSETATAIPAYAAPRILYPLNGTVVSAESVQLSWLPSGGVLNPDESYMILMTDATVSGSPRNAQFFTQGTSYRLPPDYGPLDGTPRTIYWQLVIARVGADGMAIPLSEKSPPVSFTWQKP